MFLPVVGDGAVAASVQETVGELCFVALAVVGFKWCFVWVARFVSEHGLAADVAGGAVFEVVEELIAACLVVVPVSALGCVAGHVTPPLLLAPCSGREPVARPVHLSCAG